MSHPVISLELLADMELDELRAAADARQISSKGNAPTVRSRIRKWQEVNLPAAKESSTDSKSDVTASETSQEAPAATDAPAQVATPAALPAVKTEEAEAPTKVTAVEQNEAQEASGTQESAPPVLPSPTTQVASLSKQTAPLVVSAAPPAQTEPTGAHTPVGIPFTFQRAVAEGCTLVRLHGDNKIRKIRTPIEHGGRARANSLYGSRVSGFVNDEIAAGAVLLPDPSAVTAEP